MYSDNIDAAARARADRERAEYGMKVAKAKAFLAAEGTVAEREAKASIDPVYIAASRAYFDAVEDDERYRNNRSKCVAILDAWRTVSATERAFARVR